MKSIIVLDSSGDSTVTFDPAQAESDATREAKALFDRLTLAGSKFFAVNREGGQTDKMVKNFNELEQENVAVPRIVGG